MIFNLVKAKLQDLTLCQKQKVFRFSGLHVKQQTNISEPKITAQLQMGVQSL